MIVNINTIIAIITATIVITLDYHHVNQPAEKSTGLIINSPIYTLNFDLSITLTRKSE